MAKLSSAQARELEKIKARYDDDLERAKQYYISKIENYNAVIEGIPIEHFKEGLELTEKGFILWGSPNSKTLQKIAEAGYIEYLKTDLNRIYPLDWIRLIKN